MISQTLTVGMPVTMRGFVTKASILRGKPADRLEQELGFQAGRLADGWHLLFLLRKPTADEFQYRGYTQMSGGVAMGHLAAPPDPRNAEQRLRDDGVDLAALKANTIATVFTLQGPDRLAKVAPVRDGLDYPPGLGQPQWELTAALPFTVAAFVGKGGMYSGGYS